MAGDWNGVVAAAKKILGPKAKIPPPKGNGAKFAADYDKAEKEYDAAIEVLQGKILASQNAMAAGKNVMRTYANVLSRSSLGLDPNNEEEKKKIDEALKVLNGFLDTNISNAEKNIKGMDELTKHTMALSKYQSQRCS